MRTRKDSHFDAIGSTSSIVGNTSLTPTNPALITKTFSFTTGHRLWEGCANVTERGVYLLEFKVGTGVVSQIFSINENTEAVGFTCFPSPTGIPTITASGPVFTLSYDTNTFLLAADNTAFSAGVTSIPASVSFRKLF